MATTKLGENTKERKNNRNELKNYLGENGLKTH